MGIVTVSIYGSKRDREKVFDAIIVDNRVIDYKIMEEKRGHTIMQVTV